jgi:hypothetical protein
MIDVVDKEQLRRLIEWNAGPAVSIYLPAGDAGLEAQQNQIRLKNLLTDAKRKLRAFGVGVLQTEGLLAPIEQLRQDPRSWDQRACTLALFANSEGLRQFHLPVRFEELVVVADAFHVKPLFHLLNRNGRFYVLALSQDQVRLLRGSQYGFMRVRLEDALENVADAIKRDDREKQLQFHTGTPGGSGKRVAMFHGQGSGIDNARFRLDRYLRLVEQSVAPILGGAREPLILACVDPIAAAYQAINTYSHLVGETIRGNPDTRQDAELWSMGWSIAKPLIMAHQVEAIRRYKARAPVRPASEDIEQIGIKARQGAVEELFVALGHQRWGKADVRSHRVEVHSEPVPGDRDLLDLAATETFRHGGQVYALEEERMPAKAPAAALLRF